MDSDSMTVRDIPLKMSTIQSLSPDWSAFQPVNRIMHQEIREAVHQPKCL